MNILPACICMRIAACRGQEEAQEPLELGLQWIWSQHVGSGNWTLLFFNKISIKSREPAAGWKPARSERQKVAFLLSTPRSNASLSHGISKNSFKLNVLPFYFLYVCPPDSLLLCLCCFVFKSSRFTSCQLVACSASWPKFEPHHSYKQDFFPSRSNQSQGVHSVTK